MNVSGNVPFVSPNLLNFAVRLGLVLLLRWRKFERSQIFVIILERADWAPDDTEKFRQLRRACPRVVAAAGVEGEGAYGRLGRSFEPCVRLVEGEQKAAVQDGGDTVEGVHGSEGQQRR